MPRNDDLSLILAKAKANGFFPDVPDTELEVWKQKAKSLFVDDVMLRPGNGDSLLTLATALKNPYASFGIQATGDSTTTPDTAWFRLLANQCAAEFPSLTHHYRKWNDTTQNFDRPIVLNSGSSGRRAMVTATGGTRVGVKYDGTTNITGDLEVIYNGKIPNYATGTSQVFAAKYDTDNSWYCQIGGDGKLYYNWSTDGTTFVGVKASTAVIPFANNTECWFKIIHDIDNGAAGNDVKFYTSNDGTVWTQLGSTVTTAGVTTRFASTSRYSLGARGGASTPLVDSSRTYEIQIRDGIDGPSVVPYLPDMWEQTIGTGVPTFEGSPVVTWVMSAQPGAGLGYDAATVGYLMDPVRMKKMAPNFNQLVHFFNSSHNEYDLHGNLWAAKYGAWVDAISINTPLSSRIALTQNPRTGVSNESGPKIRRFEMQAFAKRKAGLYVIDTYQAFLDDGRPVADLIGDNIHPNNEGYIVQKNYIKAELDAALVRVSSYV